MKYGWVCPKCGRVYSELVTQCKYCNDLIDKAKVREVPLPVKEKSNTDEKVKTVPLGDNSHITINGQKATDEELENLFKLLSILP